MIFRTFLSSAFALLLAAAACLSGAGPARAQDALYTVNGVHVDATAASSGEALNHAIAQGRAKAFQILYRRLTRQDDWQRQPPLDAAGLLRLSRGTNITNERRSTTRYVADVTYMFNPDAVQRTLLRRARSPSPKSRPSPSWSLPCRPASAMAPGPGADVACLARQPGAFHGAGAGGRCLAGGAQFRRGRLERCVRRRGERITSAKRRWCRRSMPAAR